MKRIQHSFLKFNECRVCRRLFKVWRMGGGHLTVISIYPLICSGGSDTHSPAKEYNSLIMASYFSQYVNYDWLRLLRHGASLSTDGQFEEDLRRVVVITIKLLVLSEVIYQQPRRRRWSKKLMYLQFFPGPGRRQLNWEANKRVWRPKRRAHKMTLGWWTWVFRISNWFGQCLWSVSESL